MAKKIKTKKKLSSPVVLSLVVPAFNEEHRLEKSFKGGYAFLKKNISSFEIILVNDGSTDKTQAIFEKLAKRFPEIKLISYAENRGKGYAVKKGVEQAVGKIIGYTDADFAISLSGVPEIVTLIQNGTADIVIGDRNAGSSRITNSPNFLRRFFGTFLSLLNSVFLSLGGISDTQCGFKFFKHTVAKELFKNNYASGWLFDIELLIQARKSSYQITKAPVEWKEEADSKVNIRRDFLKVGSELVSLYFRFYPLRILSFILLIILGVIMFPFLLFPQNLTLRAGDYSDLVWPNYYFIKEAIYTNHQIPLWNPTVFSGIPEIANPQSPLLYPLNALALVLPIDLALVLLIIFHFYIGGIFIYKFGSLLNLSQRSRLIFVLGFVFSPFFWSKVAVGHLSQFFAIMLTAPILYFGLLFFQKKRFLHLGAISFFLSLQYLNYPTIWYYSCFFGLIILFYCSFIKKKYHLFFWYLFATVVSLLLILPLFLVQLNAGPQITRSELSLTDLGLPLWSLKRFLISVITPSNLLSDLETEVWLYPSFFLLALSMVGLIKLKRIYLLLLSFVLLLVMVITLGNRTPFFSLFTTYIPGFSYLRVTTRDWFIFIILVSFLASLAIQTVKPKLKNVFFMFVALDLICFSALRIWFVPEVMKANNGTNFDYLLKESQYRYYCTKRCLSASQTIPKKITTADGYHLVILKNYRQALSQAGGFEPTSYTGNIPAYDVRNSQPSAEELGKFSIKYLVTDHYLEDPNFISLSRSCGYSLYENTKVLSRFRFNKNSLNTIKVTKDTPNDIVVETDVETADRFVLADPYYKGWEVWVDGQEENIIEEDGWARAIDLRKGKHVVEFKFNPFGHLIDTIL